MTHGNDKFRPEVIWEGKYDQQGHRRDFCPNAGLVQRRLLEVFGEDPGGELILGDNLADAQRLLDRYRGKVRLIYIDPPFNLGKTFTAQIQSRHDSTIEVDAYIDSWGADQDSFAHMLWLRLKLAHELLTDNGTIFLHCNDHTSPLARALLDDVFGHERFLNQIIWHYTGGGRSRKVFSNKHDTIYWYAKGKTHPFNIDAVRQPYKTSSAYAKSGIKAKSGKLYMPHPDGTPVDDVWDIPMLNPMSKERTPYPTQKPLSLLKRIIAAASMPGDLVADLFCGSGTTALAAHELERRWIALDRSPLAVATTRSRLLKKQASYSLRTTVLPSESTQTKDSWVTVTSNNNELKLEKVELKSEAKPSGWGVCSSDNPTQLLAWCDIGSKIATNITLPLRIVIYCAAGERWEGDLSQNGSKALMIRIC